MMSFDQAESDNRDEFIQRLIEAGWTRSQAEIEWENVQKDEEGSL